MTPLPDTIKKAWLLVALSKSLRRGAVRGLTVAGQPIVLFRTQEGLGALQDRCPHRNYPLSQGRIRGNTLECPYHGWRFGADGACRAVPGCEIPGHALRAGTIAVAERHGGIFVRLGEDGATEPELPPLVTAPGHDSFWWEQGVWQGRVYDAIENVLDPFHTNFVHHGFIRRYDRRQPVELEVSSFARGIEMVIRQPQPDHGAMSFFLERDRQQSRTRYYPPTVVQARWEGQQKLTLCVTAFFTPVDETHFRPFACFTTPSGVAPAWLKQAAIRLFLAPVIAQDRQALEDQFGVLRQFGGPRYLEGPGDILGNRVHRLYIGEAIPECSEPARMATL
jgi:phenylpropionate dioxygenase-like ring-hydroxylating dioxygenase large terminal subunit